MKNAILCTLAALALLASIPAAAADSPPPPPEPPLPPPPPVNLDGVVYCLGQPLLFVPSCLLECICDPPLHQVLLEWLAAYSFELVDYSHDLAEHLLLYLFYVQDYVWATGDMLRQDANALLSWWVCTLYQPDCGPMPEPRVPPNP